MTFEVSPRNVIFSFANRNFPKSECHLYISSPPLLPFPVYSDESADQYIKSPGPNLIGHVGVHSVCRESART